eukprot:TRINITY_DN388_c0_g4_i1.p1 TRINITY_DN388_c0_g4~~TRINITY_DN388_c0_g4_i1.p1  ORF type:complete len:317 (-),score=90.08 TRINITY_DN388_c0_g4_i1:186-1076(-)
MMPKIFYSTLFNHKSNLVSSSKNNKLFLQKNQIPSRCFSRLPKTKITDPLPKGPLVVPNIYGDKAPPSEQKKKKVEKNFTEKGTADELAPFDRTEEELKAKYFPTFGHVFEPSEEVSMLPPYDENEVVEKKQTDERWPVAGFYNEEQRVLKDPQPAVTPAERTPQNDALGRSWGSGTRKSSRAICHVKTGTGKFIVNNKSHEIYFTRTLARERAILPLQVTESMNCLDVFVKVRGGGLSGQAGACAQALAKALIARDPDVYPPLRLVGLLENDIRRVEPKKSGKKKARKSFQWHKR